jgi:hypothetical protein
MAKQFFEHISSRFVDIAIAGTKLHNMSDSRLHRLMEDGWDNISDLSCIK